MIASWGRDSQASDRMNAIEDRLTTHGAWEPLEHPVHR
jgi:hypothetical protein